MENKNALRLNTEGIFVKICSSRIIDFIDKSDSVENNISEYVLQLETAFYLSFCSY